MRTLIRPHRRVLSLTVALTAAAALATLPASASAGGVTLNIGTQTDGLRALFSASGALKGASYKINWSTFASGEPLTQALQAGKIDVGAVGNTPPIFAAATRPDFRIVAGIQNRTHVQSHIVVSSSSAIKNVAGLKGKTIAYTQGTITQAFLVQALGRVGLKLKDVKLANLQPSDGLAAFSAGRVDAWITYQPFLAIIGSRARVLPTGTGYAADGLNVELASTNVLDDPAKKAALRDYLVRVNRALQWGNGHPQGWAQAFSSSTGLPVAVAQKAFQNVDLIPASSGVTSTLQTLANLLHQAGLVKQVNISSVVSNQVG